MDSKHLRQGNLVFDRFGKKTKILFIIQNGGVLHDTNDIASSGEFMKRIPISKEELELLEFEEPKSKTVNMKVMEKSITGGLTFYSEEPFDKCFIKIEDTGKFFRQIDFVDEIQNLEIYLKNK